MRVSLAPVERPRLLFFMLPPKSLVLAKVEFDPVEEAIIARYHLLERIVVPRKPLIVYETVTITECDRSYQRKEKRDVDQNIRLRHLHRQVAHFPVDHPAAGKAFIAELRQGLVELKAFLEANGAHSEPVQFTV